MNAAQVRILGTQYLVVIDGHSHVVGKDKRCHTCPDDGTVCPAVYAVARYLKAGGPRAPSGAPAPPRAKSQLLPACPICGAPVEPDHALDRTGRGPGWRCTAGGYAHLYLHRYPNAEKWFCGEGARRHAMCLPDEPAVQLCLPALPTNIVPFAKSHQDIEKAA
ncbi:MAG: hypothetical protein JW934_19020 [Anaerolineae bacterium]|nr:hypothetical protein [Anaerolineae bacterium]